MKEGDLEKEGDGDSHMLKKIKIAMERTVTIHSQLTVTIHHPSVVFTFMMRSVVQERQTISQIKQQQNQIVMRLSSGNG